MMDRVDECVCCEEIPEMISLNEEAVILEKLKDPLVCITDNPGFWAVFKSVGSSYGMVPV